MQYNVSEEKNPCLLWSSLFLKVAQRFSPHTMHKMDCPIHVVCATTRVDGKHVGNVSEKRMFHESERRWAGEK